jgi:hypothetical protein
MSQENAPTHPHATRSKTKKSGPIDEEVSPVGEGLDLINLENAGAIGTQNRNPPVLRTPPPPTPAPAPATSSRGDGSERSGANTDPGSNSLNGHYKTPMNTGAIPKTTNRDVYGSAYAPYDGATTLADTAL